MRWSPIWWLAQVFVVVCSAFLQKDLPLELLSTTPSEINFETENQESVNLQGSGPITAVFSRAVVALGSDFGVDELPEDKIPFTLSIDIPGRLYWVTSYIARFDPIEEWPLDMDVTLTWNTELTTYDGIKLTSSQDSPQVKLTSRTNWMSCSYSTESLLALYVTDGYVSDGYWEQPEFLPDARKQIQFAGNVSVSLMPEVFELRKGDEDGEVVSDVGINVEACSDDGREEDDCIWVSFDQSLEQGQEYTLVFPQNAVYSSSGVSKLERDSCTLYGPNPFSLVSTTNQGWWDISSRRIQTLLVHGLSSKNTVDDLKKQITIQKQDNKEDVSFSTPADPLPGTDLDFELELEGKALLTLTAEFEPQQYYVITVTGTEDIKDAFGYPLVSQVIKVDTENWPQDMLQPNAGYDYPPISLEESADWDGMWPVLSAGSGEEYNDDLIQSISYWSVPVDDEIIEEVLLLCTMVYEAFYYQNSNDPATRICNNLKDYLGEPQVTVVANGQNEFRIEELEMGKLLEPSGLVVYQKCCEEGRIDDEYSLVADKAKIIMQRSISAQILFKCSTHTAVVIVWSMVDGSPVGGAEVQLFKIDSSTGEEIPSKVGSIITNENGVAKFQISDWDDDDNHYPQAIIKTSDGKIIITDRTNRYSCYNRDLQQVKLGGRLIVDHKLVRPSEGFYVSGYVRQLEGDEWRVPSEELKFYLELDEGLSDGGEWYNIEVEDSTGSFVAPIGKSTDLKPQYYRIELKATLPDGSTQLVDSIMVTGSDPRTPTAFLSVFAPNWVRPNSTFEIEIKTDSYIGAQLRDQEIKVQYEYYSEDNEYIENSFLVTTNENGRAIAIFNLLSLAPNMDTDQSFRVDIEWIGPTRECLTDARSIAIHESELSLNLQTSVNSVVMPGIEFGVVATLEEVDQMTGERTEVSLPVDIELVQGQEKEGESTCKIDANVLDYEACRISLDQASNYTLSGCVMDSQNQRICDTISMGKSLEDWTKTPLDSFDFEWKIIQQDEQLLFEVPIQGSTLFLYTHSDLGDDEQVFQDLPSGLNTIPFKINPFCYNSCYLNALLTAPRKPSFDLPDDVPVSKFFKATAPVSFTFNLFVDVPPNSTFVDVGLTLSSLTGPQNSSLSGEPIVVQPEEPVRLDITSLLPSLEVADTEIIVFIVDRSILDVIPTPVINISEIVRVDLSGQEADIATLGRLVHTPSVINIARDFFLKMNGIDPWLTPEMLVIPDQFLVLPADMGEERYLLDNVDNFLSSAPRRDEVPTLAELGDFAKFLSHSAKDESAEVRDLDKIGEGVKFKEFRYAATPVHAILETGDDGKATVAFNAPINLGRFNIRAYGATTNNLFGFSELDFIVRRALSLTLAAPRQVRINDTFQAGVIITISADEVTYFDDDVIEVELTAVASDPIKSNVEGSLDSVSEAMPLTTTISVVVGVPVEVGFQFLVESIGDGEVVFNAKDSKGSSDERKAAIPVNGQQEAVSLASSFAVQGSVEGEGWEEGLQIPEAVAGSGKIDISAGVGRLPAIQAYTNAFMEDLSNDDPSKPESHKAMTSVVVDSILTSYNTVDEEVSAASEKALNDLTLLTKSDNGLLWYIPDSIFRAIDIDLNAWALWASYEASAYKEIASSIDNLRSVWEQKMLEKLVEDAEYYREEQVWRKAMAYPSLDRLAHVRLAVGPDWMPSEVSEEVVQDLSVTRLYNEVLINSHSWSSMGIKVDTALVALTDNVHEEAADVISSTQKSILASINVRGRTAYMSSSEGATSPADLETQSKALLFLLRNGDGDNPLVEKLANYIASQQAFAFYIVAATLSLAEYDKVKGSVNPDLELNVRSGETVMLKAKFDEPGDPIVNTTSFDSLTSPPEPIEFKATGVGEVSFAALLDFIPVILYPFPQYRGIYVERILQGSDNVGDAFGPPLATIPVSSVVNLVIQVSSPFDVGAAEVVVLMAGGLEAVDPNVPSCRPNGNEICYAGRNNLQFTRYFYPACPKMEVYPDRVIFRYPYLRSGTQDISFKAIAATTGDFVLPPVQAYSIQEPEIMGLSSSGAIKICKECEVGTQEVSSNLPIECPNNCNGLGVCNIDEGACICNSGYTGTDCGEIVIA